MVVVGDYRAALEASYAVTLKRDGESHCEREGHTRLPPARSALKDFGRFAPQICIVEESNDDKPLVN